MKSNSPIVSKSFALAILIVKLYQKLMNDNLWDIARQILKSGTSIGANSNEAQSAESTKDFNRKLSIAQKESKELNFWLNLISESELIMESEVREIKVLNIEILKMISSAIVTSKKKLKLST